jgi:fucose permease
MTDIADTTLPFEKYSRILTPSLGLFLLAVGCVLVWARSFHYLLFHTLVELIAIAVGFSIFSLTWASWQHL